MNKKYTICFVFTGNACRSPFAECVLKSMLEQEGMDNIEVFSRGTLDWGENPRDANMVRIARELGYDFSLLPNRQWNQRQKHKKQPWSKVECFAFGGATVRFASLETSIHAANHTIPPPPSYEGSPHCPKDKNRSPFHGEKP